MTTVDREVVVGSGEYPPKRVRTIALADEIRAVLDLNRSDTMPHGTIDKLIADLRALRLLMGKSPDNNFAIHCLEKLKRHRSDKWADMQRAKNAVMNVQVTCGMPEFTTGADRYWTFSRMPSAAREPPA